MKKIISYADARSNVVFSRSDITPFDPKEFESIVERISNGIDSYSKNGQTEYIISMALCYANKLGTVLDRKYSVDMFQSSFEPKKMVVTIKWS